MTIETDIRGYLDRLLKTLDGMPVDAIASLSDLLYRAYSDGKQVFTLGNGGSASTASHMAADLGKNTIGPNMRRFRIMSLNDNIPLLTALSNDLGYENMFAEQLQNLIQPGDVLIVLTGSGKSPNVLRAMEYARSRSAEVAALLGFDGGPAMELADLSVLIDSSDYGVIEDAHLIINHILVEHFRQRLAAEHPWSA
jgi:D-sedoheptulose 7-phosphate isomerase